MSGNTILLVILTALTTILLAERAAAAVRRQRGCDAADVFYRLRVSDSAVDDDPVDMYYRTRTRALKAFGSLKRGFLDDGVVPEGPDKGFDFSAVDGEFFVLEWEGAASDGRKVSLGLYGERFLPEEKT